MEFLKVPINRNLQVVDGYALEMYCLWGPRGGLGPRVRLSALMPSLRSGIPLLSLALTASRRQAHLRFATAGYYPRNSKSESRAASHRRTLCASCHQSGSQ